MLVTIPPRSLTKDSAKTFQSQGLTQLVVAVQVRNVGRLPVTVSSWSLKTMPGGIAVQPVGQSIGPPLPHRLEGGESETWAMDRSGLMGVVATTASVLKIPVDRIGIRGEVTLGDGRTVRAKGSL
jgi:hypothetical protein